MSDWADGVFSAPTASGGGAVMSKLLGTASMANPLSAVAGAMMTPDTVTATSSASGNKFGGSFNSNTNFNFGGGSITSSAAAGVPTESLSQWIGIAAGIVTILVALKIMKG